MLPVPFIAGERGLVDETCRTLPYSRPLSQRPRASVQTMPLWSLLIVLSRLEESVSRSNLIDLPLYATTRGVCASGPRRDFREVILNIFKLIFVHSEVVPKFMK